MAKRNFEYSNEELADLAIANLDFKSPQFQLYTNDILGSNRVLMLTDLEYRAYLNLLFSEWNEPDCGLPTTVDALVKLSRVGTNLSPENVKNIKQFFFEYKERLFNRRILEERVKQIKKREINTANINKRYEKATTKPTTEGILDNDSKASSDKDKDTDNDIDKVKKRKGKGESREEKEQEELKKAYKEDPSLLFVRFWRRNAGIEEVNLARKHIETFGIDLVTTGFFEAMSHAAFSLSYVEAVCKNQRAKQLSIAIENKSDEEKLIEKQELKALEEKVNEEANKYQNGLWERYRIIEKSKKASQKQLNKIHEHLQNKEFISADVQMLDIENPNVKNKSSPIGEHGGFQGALKVVADNILKN